MGTREKDVLQVTESYLMLSAKPLRAFPAIKEISPRIEMNENTGRHIMGLRSQDFNVKFHTSTKVRS